MIGVGSPCEKDKVDDIFIGALFLFLQIYK